MEQSEFHRKWSLLATKFPFYIVVWYYVVKPYFVIAVVVSYELPVRMSFPY